MKHIHESQVTARAKGWVTYLNADGVLKKIRDGEVTVHPDGATLPEDVSEVAAPAAVEAVTAETPTPTKAAKVRKPKAATAGDEKMATKKKAAKKKAESASVRTIGGKEVDVSGYTRAKAPGGGVSYNNGDEIATKLAGKTLDDVYAFAAKTLKVDEKELRSKYKNLNPGMQRMNLGNRVRGALAAKQKAAA